MCFSGTSTTRSCHGITQEFGTSMASLLTDRSKEQNATISLRHVLNFALLQFATYNYACA
jgi:hypothetical protein